MSIRRPKLSPETYELGALHLYREELKAIASTVQELGSLEISCKAKDGTYEATEPGDLDEIPEELKEVTITAKTANGQGSVIASFSEDNAHITLEEPDILIEGIRSRISAVCMPLRRRAWWFCKSADNIVLVVGVLGLIGLLIGAANNEKSRVWNSVWLNWIIPSFFLALIVIGFVMQFYYEPREVIIINAPRADRPSYWQRTGDMWMVGVVTAIIGAIIGFILGKVS
jgi:hypothetical protein